MMELQEKEKLQFLCQHIQVEKDPAKLTKLVNQLNELLKKVEPRRGVKQTDRRTEERKSTTNPVDPLIIRISASPGERPLEVYSRD